MPARRLICGAVAALTITGYVLLAAALAADIHQLVGL
jgi:hypothetical protein